MSDHGRLPSPILKQKPALSNKGGFPQKTEAMPVCQSEHRASQGPPTAWIGNHKRHARGSESGSDSEPPGSVCAEIQPGDRPFQECDRILTSPPPWLEGRGLVGAAGLVVTYRVFRGNDARETPEPPETVQPRSNRATSPIASAGPSSRTLFRSDLQEVSRRSGRGRKGPAAAATTLSNSMPCTGSVALVRPVGRTLPWDNLSIHPRENACQEFLQLFATIQVSSQTEPLCLRVVHA